MDGPLARQVLLCLLFVLSGAAGLVYELVWTRQLILLFGGTTYAITTVLVAFMGGLGLGSYLAGRLSQRLHQPGALYGLLEIGIGLYAFAVPLLLQAAEPLYRAMYPAVEGRLWPLTAARFVVGTIVLVLPTTLMGATLPILVRFVTLLGGGFGRSVGVMYGVNTLGAVLGVLATGFYLVPTLGVTLTTRTAAGINFLIGLTAIAGLRLSRAAPSPAMRSPRAAPGGRASRRAVARQEARPLERAVPPAGMTAAQRAAVLVVFAISGFAAMAYQIAWTRALVLSIGSSTYSFTCILAAFILGLGAGSLIVAGFVDRIRSPLLVIGGIELAIGLSAILMVPIYGRLPPFIYDQVSHFVSFERLLGVEFALVIAVTLIPTLLMGALFPLVTRAVAHGTDDASAATGRAYAVNTLGTILGSFLAGFFLIRSQVLGVQNSIVVAAVLNAAAGALLIRLSATDRKALVRRMPPALVGLLAVPAAAFAVAETPGLQWDPLLMSSGPYLGGELRPQVLVDNYELLYYGEGPDLTVLVARGNSDPEMMFLTVNGKTDASTTEGDMLTQVLAGHVPLLIAEQARDVCVIGCGSGMTLAAVARYPEVERIDQVEISEDVLAGALYFADFNYRVLTDDPRVQRIHNDGRNHLLLTDRVYDLIISEPSNPWIAGVANLFTREFFELSKRRLAEHGRYCIWMHAYNMSHDNFKLVARTLADVFPFVSIWEASENDYMFIAAKRPAAVPLARVRLRFAVPQVREDLYRVEVGRLHDVLGRFVAAGEAVRRWAGPGVLHRDDNALLEFSAPRQLYQDESIPIAEALFATGGSPFGEVMRADPDSEADRELVERVRRVAEARVLRWRSYTLADSRAELETLLEAAKLDPGNPEINEALLGAKRGIERDSPALARQPEIARLLDELRWMRRNIRTPKTGASLPDIAGTLRMLASEAEDAGAWPLAADYLSEALELTPGDAALIEQLAVDLARAGQIERAIRELEKALKAGVISIAALSERESLAALRAAPEFQALLERTRD